ncbi:hypothetical protein H4R24_003997 [Coemansia sp. RSA 988]|nr:hypothetical protein H4R24_003997 [Coemansia sp. RSA 988]
MDESRSHTRNRYSSAQGYQGSRRYPEDRVARSPVRDRYGSRAPGASRPYNRPQGGRGGYGSRPAYRGGGGRNTNRSGFFERGGRGIEEHHSQDQQDPQDKYDHYRPQSAIHNDDQQGWIADDPVRADSGQLSPRNSRSRSISVERNANSGWLRSPSPVNGKAKMDVANNISNREGTNSFNEDSLFAAP